MATSKSTYPMRNSSPLGERLGVLRSTVIACRRSHIEGSMKRPRLWTLAESKNAITAILKEHMHVLRGEVAFFFGAQQLSNLTIIGLR